MICTTHQIRVIKSGRIRWAGHAARVGERGIPSFGEKLEGPWRT